MTNRRVSLVVPPFLSVVRPSLAISALKSALTARNHDVQVHYCNMRFAEEIGADLNEWVSIWSDCRWLIGEWIFAPALYTDLDLDHDDGYVEAFLGSLPDHLISALIAVRQVVRVHCNQLAREILSRSPRLVGITTSFQQNCAALSIAREIKSIDPSVVVCLGGANCEGEMGATLLRTFPQVDFVFSGESDRSFPDFIDDFFADDESQDDIGYLPTINQHRRQVIGKRVEDLDALPVPDFGEYFESLSIANYRSNVEPGLLFEGSRGCWWGAKHHCKFCGLNGSNMIYRSKSPTRVLNELSELAGRWGVNRFEAVDNILDMKHVNDVFGRLADETSQFEIFYEVKSNMTHSQLHQAAKGGVTWVQPGIESLDDTVLNIMDKGVTGLQNISFLRSCAELGIRPVWNILYGFPDETKAAYDRMANLVPAISHLFPPDGCCNIRLDRFSPYFERWEEYGFSTIRPMPAYEYVYQESAETIRNLAYYFQGERAVQKHFEYLGKLENAVSSWRDRHRTDVKMPVLALINLAGTNIVRDTRLGAKATSVVLSDDETEVLRAFRSPGQIDRVMTRITEERMTLESAKAALQRLFEMQFLVRDDARAVSVVCEYGWRVHNPEKSWIFPGGVYFRDRNAVKLGELEDAATNDKAFVEK